MSVLAAAAACQTMYGPVETPLAPVASEGIQITIGTVADESASFTLAPKGEATYYSYYVEAGDAPRKLDSLAVYSCGYDEGEAAGTFKWTAETPSAAVELKDLQPATTYQIYAVSGSAMGIPGSVETASFTTSDGVSPELEEYETDGSTLYLLYSEDVQRADGAMSVKYYAYNSDEIFEGQHIGTVQIAEEDVAIEGAIVAIDIKGLPAGAYYAFDAEAGAFMDASGNLTAALSSACYCSDEDYEVYPDEEGDGIIGRAETKNFQLGAIAQEDKKFNTEDPYFLIDFGSDYGYGYTTDKGSGSAVYTLGNKTTSYTLAARTDFGYLSSQGKVVIYLPEAGEKGNNISLSIEEGVFEDYYGNLNDAWEETGLVYVYGYTLADIVGSYNMTGKDGFSGEIVNETLVIAESNNPKKGNVMITYYFGLPCMTPIYGTFDVDKGTLTVNNAQPFFQMTESGVQYTFYFFTYEGAPSVTFSVPEPGVIKTPSGYFGYAYAANGKLQDYMSLLVSFEATRSENAGAPSAKEYKMPDLKRSVPLDAKL